MGYGDWVNVGPPRMLDDRLIIDVVYHNTPNHGTSAKRRYRRDTIWIELYAMDPDSSIYRFPWQIAGEKKNLSLSSDA
jgi:hypothetical protein